MPNLCDALGATVDAIIDDMRTQTRARSDRIVRMRVPISLISMQTVDNDRSPDVRRKRFSRLNSANMHYEKPRARA